MSRIYKYPFTLSEVVKINLPVGAWPFHVSKQGDGWFLWAIVKPKMEAVPHEFAVVGTGFELPKGCTQDTYLTTFHMPPFVWHVFDLGQAKATNG